MRRESSDLFPHSRKGLTGLHWLAQAQTDLYDIASRLSPRQLTTDGGVLLVRPHLSPQSGYTNLLFASGWNLYGFYGITARTHRA